MTTRVNALPMPKPPRPAKPAKKHLWPELKTLYPQQDPDKVDVEELKQRFLVTIALEAARVMEEGIVTDPRADHVGCVVDLDRHDQRFAGRHYQVGRNEDQPRRNRRRRVHPRRRRAKRSDRCRARGYPRNGRRP